MKKELSIEKQKEEYIDRYDPNIPDLDRTLRTVRYILRTPEGADVVEHAKKIMAALNKQKAEFLAKKGRKKISGKLTPARTRK